MKKQERTVLLEALCILSFIGNGIAIALYLISAVWNHAARNLISDWAAGGDVSRFNTHYFLIFTGLYLFSLTGVLLMWRMKKSGWFLYVTTQTIVLILPSLWLGELIVPSAQIIFTVLFVALYTLEIFRVRSHSLDP